MNHACIKALLKGRMEVQRKYDSCGSVASCGSKSSDEDDDKECSSIYSAGVRSPTAVRCRSIKELEEQLANLRKENFNLKLRIYFLEERMGTNFHLDKESAVKKNIELMVEVESLRKELQEKQDLLCQAVKAMELEEEEHKKESDLKESENQILQQKIEDLNQRIQDLEGTTTQDGDTLLQKIKALEVELAKEKETSSALSEILKSQSTETDVDVTALTQELQLKEQQINQLYNQLHEFNTKFVNSNQRTRSLESELDRLNIELQSKISEIEKLQNEVATRGLEADNLKGTAASLEDMYKKESEKSEKFKKAVLLCNNKMANLEKTCEMQRAKIRNLELKLDSVQNEVKKKAMELANSKSPVRRKKSPLTDVDSFSVPDSSTNTKKESSSTITLSNEAENEKGLDNKIEEGTVKVTKEEKSERDAKMLKLKAEHYKACQIIKTMMGKQKERDCEIERLREKLRHMEGELQESRKKENQNGNAQKSNALHSKSAKTKHSPTSSKPASDLENSMADVTDDAAKLADQYKNLAAELEKQVKMLMETLKEKDHQMQRAKDSLLQEIKEKEDRITDLEFELITMNAEVNKSHNSSEKNDEGSEKLSTFWMKEIEEKDKEIERLQSELRKRTCDLQGVVNKELWEKNKEIERMQKRFGVVVDNKEHIIKELKQTLSSRDSQLNILKDKISELGLEIDLSAVGDALNNANVSDEIKTLQEQLKSCEEERKFFMEQIEVLQQKLKSYSDQEHLAEWEQLKTEHKHLKEELRRTEQLRAESNEICTTLSTRLEELAQFLGSLLQQKCVLGFLGWRRNNKLKQIVSQSLNLSRALTTSISQHPDQSLMQLSYISDLLNSTKAENLSLSEFFVEDDDNAAAFSIIPSDITLTYQSHLQHASADKKVPESIEEQAKIITVLRSQVENLKREVELRDREINKMGGGEKIENDQDLVNILMGLPETQSKLMSPKKIMQQLISPDKAKSTKNHDNQSESESWSEPDRTVSLARIGLDDESLKPHSSHRRSKFLTSVSTESTEDDLSHTLTRTPSKRSLLAENRQTIISLNEQVLELENKIKGKDAELLSAQVALFECDNMLKEERLLTEKHQQQFQELQSKLDELEQKLQNAVKNTNETENELVRTKQQLEESLQALQEEKKVNQDLQNEIQELQSQKVQAIQTAEEAKEGARLANNELNETKQKLNKLQDDFKTIKQRHDAIQKEHEATVRRVQQYAETEIAKAHASVEEMQKVIKKEYIKKTEVDRRVLEFEGIIQELEHLKDMLRKAEQKVQSMEQQEIQLKQTLHDVENQHREKMAALHKDKDSATLQYSEAILEKTKLANEKAILEQTVKNFNAKEAELLEQVGEFQKEVGEMKTLFQQQMVTTEREKCKLEVRVSELESLNAELRNKLIKLQVGVGEPLCSVSLPSSPNHVYDFCAQGSASINANPYSRQCSGYTSEEQQHSLVVNEQIQGAVVEAERHQANSSPDLGIESDQGRFSSLEANLPRPYLKTLELTASMNNLLDGDSQLVQYDCCINELCRKKSRAVITENNELKKSLIRTKRALDETVAQLKMANHHKKQVEKTICKQINKTSQVLRKARANLDSGSETDVCKY